MILLAYLISMVVLLCNDSLPKPLENRFMLFLLDSSSRSSLKLQLSESKDESSSSVFSL